MKGLEFQKASNMLNQLWIESNNRAGIPALSPVVLHY